MWFVENLLSFCLVYAMIRWCTHLTIALLRSLQSWLCWQWCAAQSYDACVFHLLLMLMLQFVTDEIWMGAFSKFVFIGTVSTIAFLRLYLTAEDNPLCQESSLFVMGAGAA